MSKRTRSPMGDIIPHTPYLRYIQTRLMSTYPNKRGRFRKTGMIPSFDTLFLPDKELKKTDKKRDSEGLFKPKDSQTGSGALL